MKTLLDQQFAVQAHTTVRFELHDQTHLQLAPIARTLLQTTRTAVGSATFQALRLKSLSERGLSLSPEHVVLDLIDDGDSSPLDGLTPAAGLSMGLGGRALKDIVYILCLSEDVSLSQTSPRSCTLPAGCPDGCGIAADAVATEGANVPSIAAD